MKFKSLITVLFSLVILSFPVLTNAQVATKQVAQSVNKELDRFNNSILLKFNKIDISNEKNQKMVNFRYILQNLSKKSIRQVEWVSIYSYQNKPILVQQVPVKFKKLTPKKVQNLVFSIPFDNLPSEAKQVFSNPQSEISIQFQAKSIIFTNKSKIIVK